MERWSGLHYNAVGIEHSFAVLFGGNIGQRGELWDADVFRSGDRKSIGKLLVRTSQALEQRAKELKLTDEEHENGKMGARLRVAIQSLVQMGKGMIEEGGSERDDYHWLIVGQMILLITSLFEYIEART